MNLIEVDKVSFTYDLEKYVLKDVSMKFDQGIVYGIFGKSGAGKTTLLSLIAGLETAKEGTVFYQGKSLSKLDRDRYRSKEIGVIFQSYNLLPQLTALENVILTMDISGSKAKDKKTKAYQLLEKVGLDQNKANRKVLQLSGGEQQRVSIARAIANDSKVIIADEATGNLDKETEEEILQILLNLAHIDQKCVIMVSHASKVKEKVDVLYHLINGKLETIK